MRSFILCALCGVVCGFFITDVYWMIIVAMFVSTFIAFTVKD